MTFHSTITKAQAYPFSPLAISLGQADTAVVTIRQALDELSAEVVDSTLEELAEPTPSFAQAQTAFLAARAEASDFSANHLDGPMDLDMSEAEATFDKLCDAQYEALHDLIVAPAECVQDVVDKLTYFNECDGTSQFGALEYTRLIEADLKRVTEIPSGPFMRGPRLAWERGYAAFVEAAQVAEAFDRDDFSAVTMQLEEIAAKYPDWRQGQPRCPEHEAESNSVGFSEALDRSIELWGHRTDALISLWLLPAPSPAELAVKLKLFHQEDGHELVRAGEIVDRFVSDARRFGRLGAFVQTDGDLLNAFAGLRREMTAYLTNGCGTKEQDDAADARVEALEEKIWGARATTIEGVVAKLRIAFQHSAGGDWSDHAIVDPKHPDFIDGFCGGTNKLFWESIKDLARIGGIDLSTQGAEAVAVH
jgi:hypothetical protein